jgi:hypothetical protein
VEVVNPVPYPISAMSQNSSAQSLLDLLRELSEGEFERELDLAETIVPRLATVLGYQNAETFYEYGSSRPFADVVFSKSVDSTPWLVVELKRKRAPNIADGIFQIRRLLTTFNCPLGVLLSPGLLVIVSADGKKHFDLKSISHGQALEIFHSLRRESQPATSTTPARYTELAELIERVESAQTNDEKGKTLEALACFLLDGVTSLRCKYKNLRTRSSEIDLVVEYDRSLGQISFFEDFGRYCLVECKNWSKPVGVGSVRDFLGKLDKCKVRLGIIFSKNGVTGVDAGADALREIQSRYDRDGVCLLVFSLEEVRDIKDGKDFFTSLDRKIDSVRFDTTF